MSKPKLERIMDVWLWLIEEFPVRRTASLVLEDIPRKNTEEHLHGYVEAGNGYVKVVLDPRFPLYSMIDTLLHEWSHVKSGSYSDLHPPSFLAKQHEIDRAYWEWLKRQREERSIRARARGRSRS